MPGELDLNHDYQTVWEWHDPEEEGGLIIVFADPGEAGGGVGFFRAGLGRRLMGR